MDLLYGLYFMALKLHGVRKNSIDEFSKSGLHLLQSKKDYGVKLLPLKLKEHSFEKCVLPVFTYGTQVRVISLVVES